MKRAILLLDGQCSPCSEVGRQIQVEGLTEDSILEIGSLHDPRYREMLDRVRPNGKLEPTLLHLDGPAVSASTGVKLVASLLRIVGLRRSFRIAQLVREATADPAFDPSRRSFLIKAAGAVAVLPVLGMLGAKTATATEEETAPSPLTLAEAQAAYKLLLASAEYTEAHKAAVADGVRHSTSAALRAEEGAFVGDTVFVQLGDSVAGQRFIILMLTYVDGQGNSAVGYMMQAVVIATTNKVEVAIHVDASDLARPTVIPASAVTAGLANVRGVVQNSIEARATWSVPRDGVDVPVELIRIVPGANLVEVDEDADVASTTHGLAGLEITITQTDGTNVHTVKGSIGAANLALITDSALDSLDAERETTVYIGPPVAAPPPALAIPATPPPAGTIRFKGKNVDLALTNGVLSGTSLPGATPRDDHHCEFSTFVRCVMTPVILSYHTLCRWLPVLWRELCSIVAIWGSAMVCNIIQQIHCTPYTQPPHNCPPDC